MTLGNYKEDDQKYVDGVCVGSTTSSELFSIGIWSEGTTYDGKTVGSIVLKNGESSFPPDASITFFEPSSYPEVKIEVSGSAVLSDWEKFFKDILHHVQQLQRGKVK